MMREVAHPNILEVSEIYEGDNNIYCCGKLYKGDSLSKIINDTRFEVTESMVRSMAHRMLQALSYLESKNIIHRDIKPENVVYLEESTYD